MKRIPFNIALILISIALLILPVKAQSSLFSFEKLSLEDGLSQSTVMSIYQDSKGFLWFGTANGLNKFDGYSFTVYKHDPADSNSLSNDIVNAISEDNNGNLWVGTEEGLNKFDPVTEKVTRYISTPANPLCLNSNKIYSLLPDEDGNLWIGTFGGGLNKYEPSTNTFKKYRNDPDSTHDSSLDFIRTIKKDKQGKIWLATLGGLSEFDPAALVFKNYRKIFTRQFRDFKEEVYSLCIDKEGIIWFGTDGSLNRFNPADEKLSSFISGDKTVNTFFRIWAVINDSRENLWLGTGGNGIHLFNKKDHSFKVIRNNPSKPSSLSENSVMSLFEDRSGVIWIGSSTSGINKYIGNKNKFEHFKHDPENPNTITSDIIYGITEDHSGVLWVGTTDGLNKIDKSGNVTHYEMEPGCKTCISSNIITDIICDMKDNVWITTRWGLSKYDRQRNNFKIFRADLNKKNWLTTNNLSKIFEDKDGVLWIGSFNYGFFKFDPVKESFEHYMSGKENKSGLSSDRIYSLSEDANGNLLVGTEKGLNIFDKKSGEVIKIYQSDNKPESLSNGNLLCVVSDSDGVIWAGTYGGGLNRIDTKNNKVYTYSEAQGLPNNVVYGILPDNYGNLWLSTNKGLVKFNKKSGKIRVYDPSDGLQSYEFNSSAYYKSKSGKMFFGGVNGFNSFYPDKVIDNPVEPPVVITSVKVFQKEIGRGGIVRAKDSSGLSYNENFISFDFVSLDLTNPRKNKYAYRLEGFDKDWIEAGNRRFVSYTNLSPGEYVFRIKGSNSDDIWNETGASFSFVIYPPFWQTWWFYILSFAAVIALIVLVHKYRVRLKIRRLLDIEKIRKRIADDFHDELGHKLTKISLYSELMRNELNGSLNDKDNYLKKINDAANTLFDDTKDFIWSIDPVKDSLYDLAVYLKDFGDEFFDRTGIAFRVSEISDTLSEITLPMDWKRQLILIFKEAMNNCLRHSVCKNVRLSISVVNNNIEITLTDDGKGFTQNNGARGRGLDNMNSRAQKLGGTLLIESPSGNGTKIKFSGTSQIMIND